MGRIAGYDPLTAARQAKARFGNRLWRQFQDEPFEAQIVRGSGARDIRLREEHGISLKPLQEAYKHITWNYADIALSAWEKTRGVYVFDDTLTQELERSGYLSFPRGIFRYLPEMCIYIKCGKIRDLYGCEALVHGAYFMAENQDDDLTRVMLAVVCELNDGSLHTFETSQLDLNFQGQAIATTVYDGETKPEAQKRTRIPDLVQEFYGKAAYLCSAEPDIRNPREPRNKPNRHVRNNGPVRHWEVGYRFGAAFRKQLAEAEQRASTGHGGDDRNRPRVHVRRAHWHSFWTGPKEGERKLITKWLPPTIVNAEGGELPAVIWRQK